MKNRTTTTKGFNCFKQPAVTGDDVASAQVSEERKVSYNTRRASLCGALKAALSKTLSIKKSPSEKPPKSSKSPSKGKTLFHTKNEKNSYRSSSLSEHKETADVVCRSTNHFSIYYSNSTSTFSSSSYCKTSNSMSESKLIKQAPCDHDNMKQTKLTVQRQKLTIRDHKKCIDSYYEPKLEAFCIAVVCLGALVFCGKGYAIMACTSTWFLLSLSRGQKTYVEPSMVQIESKDSKEYKKKVIMNGLLERNQHMAS